MFSSEKNRGRKHSLLHSRAWLSASRRLPGLLIADVGVADRGANILVAKELLDFPQILPNLIE
jgi:hypothetical protein